MRIGLIGGTFDPVHIGHLIGAQAAVDHIGLDRILFVPAANPPHKSTVPISEAGHRVAMLKLAVAHNDRFGILLDEVQRGGASYTIDTIRRFRQTLAPQDELFFILGADSLVEFTTWKNWRAICRESSLVSLKREGFSAADCPIPKPLLQVEILWVDMPLIGISATDIRSRIAAGASIRYRVPHAVAEYIETHSLYGKSSS